MDLVPKHSETRKTLLPKVSSENATPAFPPAEKAASTRQKSEEGMLSLVELVIGMVIISILLVAGLMVFRVTEKGTISQKKQEQALNLAKQKVEELKGYINSQNWNQLRADVAFPDVTPAATPYQAYPPVTIKLGNNTYIVHPEVRYVYAASPSSIAYMPVPDAIGTPEVSSMVRIRADAYYGDPALFIPLPTAEAAGITLPRVVYSNIVSNKVLNGFAPGNVNGYVQVCGGGPVSNVLVGLYSGGVLLLSATTDSFGSFSFNNVQAGILNLQVVSSPGYDPVLGCNSFTNPLNLVAGQNLNNQNLAVTQIATWNYFGVVAITTPVITPVMTVLPTMVAVTATPNVVVTPTFIAGAKVFTDDTNSLPVKANASGAYTITQVRSTPVANHFFDTIGADSPTTNLTGQNFNVGTNMTTSNFTSMGQLYIGPITVYLNETTNNTQSVTFVVLTDAPTSSPLPASFYPITLVIADGSVSSPFSQVLTSPSTSVTTTVRQGIPSVAVSLTANATPGWITSNLSFNLDASVEAPITLLQYAVGTASGAVSGLGNIDYTQFQIRAYDDTGQFNYSLPITWDGVSNYGGFKYSYLRAPMPSGTRLYNFVVASGGDYSSSTDISDITYNAVTNLASPILISPLNAYLAVTVTYNGGKSYPYGAWVQAQPCPGGVCPSPVTTGLGNGLFVGNLYSGVTKGDGTVLVPVQLQNGGATSYVLNAQYIDLTNNYAVTNKFVTIGPVSQTATYLSPSGQSINF